MEIKVFPTPNELGRAAAEFAAIRINRAIAKHGEARIVLSTGSSQFETLAHLVQQEVDWSKVSMFHLDEYIGLPENHPASFVKYLREKFTTLVPLKETHFVQANGNIQENIRKLTQEILADPIHFALIGIGENAHLAFNDPPADFDTSESYIVVQLDDDCKRQQVGEGWFESLDAVPNEAVSMTVHQIMQAEVIVSSVPHQVKAEAIRNTLLNDVTNRIPATMLKRHRDSTVFLDSQSASLLDVDLLNRYQGS